MVSSKNKKIFQIGTFKFAMLFSSEFIFPSNFLKFEISNSFKDDNVTDELFVYDVTILDELPVITGIPDVKRPDLCIYFNGEQESRLLFEKNTDMAYAYYQEINSKKTEIFLKKDYLTELYIDTFFTSLFAVERRMLEQESLILHCAYIKYRGQAILFSAPSGVGKSTQAGLWEMYEKAETINGDRCLLKKVDNQWKAFGWPVCGSSGICKQEELPILAIVMLGQSKTNQVAALPIFSSVQSLYTQITVNSWNKQSVIGVFDLIEDLCRQVPVYQQLCDISENAVKCLKEVICKK